MTNVPASHGQWPGFRTTKALAWVINVGWCNNESAWVARYQDQACGPMSLAEAKAAGPSASKRHSPALQSRYAWKTAYRFWQSAHARHELAMPHGLLCKPLCYRSRPPLRNGRRPPVPASRLEPYERHRLRGLFSASSALSRLMAN
jgi:hypothetical protein